MESVLTRSEKDNLVSSFLEIVVGQTVDTATQFLQATSWKLEEAVQLFYVGNDGGGAAAPLPTSSSPLQDDPGDKESAVANENMGGEAVGDDGIRPPLPVKREVLYDDASFHRIHPSSKVAFRNFDEETKHPAVWESGQSVASSASSSQDNLASLYRPPFALMYHGPFEKAKVEASLQDKWLLVNLQSTDEFSSHMLNRDTWSNEAVAQTIRSNFIFWQVYHDTSEGKKVSTYYSLVNIPAILVIDPITGQKMRVWNGMMQPDRLLEDLLPFMDGGPQEHRAVLPCKRPRESADTAKFISADRTSKEGDREVSPAVTASIEDGRDFAGSGATGGEEPKCDKEVVTTSSTEKPIYPPLPEEPKGNRELLCRVGIRLPDGQRVQRNFLRTDPIQLLWSFCSSQLGEGETRSFRFTRAIPGVSMSLEYESKLTFAESGLSNSMISLAWE
uniref:UBX domain-containing protein 7 n=1 Tax=Anthurium amnicola TaxID=1678845 RepID=A0A1D1XQF1_9ARAE